MRASRNRAAPCWAWVRTRTCPTRIRASRISEAPQSISLRRCERNTQEPPIMRRRWPQARHQAWGDPMLDIGAQLSDGGSLSQNPDDAYDYKSSFSQNWHPQATGQAPYNSFRIPMPYGDEAFGTGNMGPNLPRGGGNLDTSVGGGTVGYPSDLPYIGAHLPIAPGDPNWTPPPSLSGPHNRGGDPARPGYDNNVLPMDLSSIPGMTLNSVPRGWQ